MRLLISTLMLAGCGLLAACDFADTTTPDRPLTGTTWQLIAFEETDGDRIPIDYGSVRTGYRDAAYTIAFTTTPAEGCINPEDPLYGTRCVKLTGYPNESPSTTYNSDSAEHSLTIYFRGTTFVGQPSGSKETEFFQALDAVTRYRIDGDRLRLTYDGGKALLFEAKASTSDW